MTQNVLLFTLCTIPSLILMWYIYTKDKTEKEPPYLLLILFIGGIISAIISSLVFSTLKLNFSFLNIPYSEMNIIQMFFKSFFIIAFLEESSKWIINYICTWKNKNFNHLYDPIVYSTFISLGFATFENILYGFAFAKYGIMPIILRGLISVPCHAAFGVFMGYYLAIAKKTNSKKKMKKSIKYRFYSLFVPIFLHFVYDLLLIKNSKSYYFLFIIYIISLYILAFNKIKYLSKIKKKI